MTLAARIGRTTALALAVLGFAAPRRLVEGSRSNPLGKRVLECRRATRTVRW
jgi:hypothetical protein